MVNYKKYLREDINNFKEYFIDNSANMIKLDAMEYPVDKTLRDVIKSLSVNEQNMNLAISIEEKNSIKFFEGLVSSFELRQAQIQLLDSQQKYLNSVIELISIKTAAQQILEHIKLQNNKNRIFYIKGETISAQLVVDILKTK